MYALLNGLIGLGVGPAVAGFLTDYLFHDRAMLDLLLALMSPRPARLVILAPGVEVCKHRNASRDPHERFEFDGYELLESDMRRDLGDLAWWFDTSALTPEETAEQLVRDAAVHSAPLRGGWNTRVDQMRDALAASHRLRP